MKQEIWMTGSNTYRVKSRQDNEKPDVIISKIISFKSVR